MSSLEPDRERLRRMLRLLQEGSGGHTKRGGGYGEQVRFAVKEITEELREDLSGEELKSLFGWTARLLLVRREALPVKQQEARREERRGPKPPPASRKAERLGTLGPKSLSTLEMLKQKLEGKDKK